MFQRLRRTYYWPQMAADTVSTVRECTQCSKNRLRLIRQVSPMRLFPPTKPLECVAIDILGPLPTSNAGHKFLLVMTDRFSKLTQVTPLKRIKTLDVARAFVNDWVFKYGAPDSLVSDNGSQFVADFFQRVCTLLRVTNLFTTTYHPQTNGQAERFNRSLMAMLRCYVEDHPDDWCSFTAALCYAYNQSVHRSTRVTPFELVLSRPPPEITLTYRGRDQPETRGKTHKQDFVERWKIALGKAAASLKEAQKRYKANFDQRLRRTRMLRVGENVFLDLHDGGMKRSKLEHEIDGPFEILEVSTATNTVVIQRKNETERVSMNRVTRAPAHLKSLGPDDPKFAATAADLAAKATEGPSWYFKKILKHRETDDGQLEFFVEWVNDPPSWIGRPDLPEESVSRYLAKAFKKRRHTAVRDPGAQPATQVVTELDVEDGLDRLRRRWPTPFVPSRLPTPAPPPSFQPDELLNPPTGFVDLAAFNRACESRL